MTYDVNSSHFSPHIQAVPGAAGTLALYDSIAAGANRLRARIGKRGGWSLLRALRKQVRQLYITEKSNFELWLRDSLRRNSAWRKSVLADLGGERALQRWERRARLALSAEPAPPRTRPESQPRYTQTSRRAHTGPKTDDLGLFRLEPLTRRPAHRSERRASHRCPSSRAPLFPALKPIGLTPDLLRGFESCDGAAAGALPDIEPFDLWARLIAPIVNVSTFLTGIESDLIAAEYPAETLHIIQQNPESCGPFRGAVADHSKTHPG